ncbi:MAG: hypothetical protein IRZ13_13315 [Acetobacteraceae bacterium]|nr:hypothetical protein [Acetobacteraceae bacterium]
MSLDGVASIGRLTAQILLDTGSVLFRPERPFMLSSGWASPVYLDIPRALSLPLARSALLRGAEARILSEVGFDGFDTIAATEQGGIAIAAMLTERLHLPFVTVRRRAQGFGADAHVEGALRPGARALLVSDVTTDGRSKARYCSGLRRAGAEVTRIFVLFKWGYLRPCGDRRRRHRRRALCARHLRGHPAGGGGARGAGSRGAGRASPLPRRSLRLVGGAWRPRGAGPKLTEVGPPRYCRGP